MAVILLDELTVNDNTLTPPIVTALIPSKEVPEICSRVPCVPWDGVNEFTVAIELYPDKESVPPGVVTIIEPPGPEGALATIRVGDMILKFSAGTPPIF